MKTPIFRDAMSVDVVALARLHVTTFNETHSPILMNGVVALARLHVTTFNETHSPILMNGPTYEVRAYQWRQAFESADGSWFCVVIEDPNGELIGFAKGQPYSHHDHPEFTGELNKIYLLREYQRRGLGRLLLSHVARRFLGRGISSMLLFGDAQNPSNLFYEAMGAERLFAASGEFHGGYGWRDLRRLLLTGSPE